MNKYKWNYNDIRINMGILEEVYKQIDDDIKPNIKTMIELYKGMLKLANKNNHDFSIFDDSFKGLELKDLISEVSLSYTKERIDILNVLLNSFIPTREYNIVNDIEDGKIVATNEQLIGVTKDFFNKMTPPNINKEFLKALESKDFLNFTYAKENGDYAGVTFYDCFLKKKYVNIARTNHLTDLITLPHEMFHYILNDYDVGIVNEYNTYFLTEVEGSLANILFGDYYYNESNYNRLFFQKYYMDVFQEGIEDLAVRNQLLDSMKNNKHIRINKLNKFMNYFEMEPFEYKEELFSYLEVPQEINIKYTLSYLVALDLYYIYKDDPDFAFYLLKNIRFHKQENDIISLLRRNHITFMEDDYDNFKRYAKELKRKEKSKC